MLNVGLGMTKKKSNLDFDKKNLMLRNQHKK